MSGNELTRLRARVEGAVQGVGFRWFVERAADELGLAGSATNLADGSVEVIAEGPRQACHELTEELQSHRSPGHVRRIAVAWNSPTGMTGFQIR